MISQLFLVQENGPDIEMIIDLYPGLDLITGGLIY